MIIRVTIVWYDRSKRDIFERFFQKSTYDNSCGIYFDGKLHEAHVYMFPTSFFELLVDAGVLIDMNTAMYRRIMTESAYNIIKDLIQDGLDIEYENRWMIGPKWGFKGKFPPNLNDCQVDTSRTWLLTRK